MYKTRSGRKVKKPLQFTPTETDLSDDFTPEEHDTDFDSDLDTADERYSDERR